MVERNRCGDSTPSRFANPIGGYAFLLNPIGCQYSRMATIAGAMSRQASRAKAGVCAPARQGPIIGWPASSTQWNRIGDKRPWSTELVCNSFDQENRRSFMAA